MTQFRLKKRPRCSLDGSAVWGRMDTGIRMAGSLHCSPETITTLLMGYQFSSVQPQYKRKFIKKEIAMQAHYKQRESESETGAQVNNCYYYSNFGCGQFVLAISAIHFIKQSGMHVSENTHSGRQQDRNPAPPILKSRTLCTDFSRGSGRDGLKYDP